MHVVLASASPRRAEILRMLGLDFTICPSDAEEIIPPDATPDRVAMELARQKGASTEGELVISADTIVVADGQILGKPKSEEEAKQMLRLLSGKTHMVYTGICINGRTDYAMAKVTFAPLSEKEIDGYVRTGEPMDKAGAYAVQGIGACFIEQIEGDFFNVMGLPVQKMYSMLKDMGVELF